MDQAALKIRPTDIENVSVFVKESMLFEFLNITIFLEQHRVSCNLLS